MATITAIKGKRGTRYRAQIRIKVKGRIVHNEALTFPLKSQAEAWAQRREVEVWGHIAHGTTDGTLGDMLTRYKAEFEGGRTKREAIAQLIHQPIASRPLADITTKDLVDHIRLRRRTVAASTALNDLIWIGVALKTMSAVHGLGLDLRVIDEAMTVCRKYGLVSKAKMRDRRPTRDEIEALSAHFQSRDSRASIPMHDIMWFAIHSARRQAEITALRWDDNEGKTGLVRDLKHPRLKEGNHRRFRYTDEALAIINRQPMVSEFIFPYNPKSVGAAFTRACHLLEIEDLRFHDLRHEATSRFFEQGMSIPEVQLHTLHESWAVLRRYTNLKP